MADFEPPTFSLGLDFDLDSEPQTAVRNDPLLPEQARPSSSIPSFRLIEDDDDFEIPPVVSDRQVPDPPRALKRLRRGSGPEFRSEFSVELRCNGDDEIEEFSSQEDPCRVNEHPLLHHHSGCSTSKVPLHGHGFLTTQSASNCKMTKREHASDITVSTSMETSSNKFMFPKLTVSPLRRFQLLDSDSDSDSDTDTDTDYPSVSEAANKESSKVDFSLKDKHYNAGQNTTMSGQKRTNTSESMSQKEDLWKDFYSEKSFKFPTPALDEVCEEYFRSVNSRTDTPNPEDSNCSSDIKDPYQMHNIVDNDEPHYKLGDPVPPAHHYFYHHDSRIQKLVRSRLPYFFPLDATNRGKKLSVPSVIDYMSQFNHGEGPKQQAAGKKIAGTSSKRGRKKKSNAEEVLQNSGSWVNPKSSASIPKDAGKRRVHAVGQSAGYWFTSPEGKKVYVSKNGQELSGRPAYSHYRKENGIGFKRSGGKKAAGKKKNTGKKKAASKKRESFNTKGKHV